MQTKPAWTPHEYQLSAIKLLVRQGSVGLFLDPGLGKTSTILAAFKILKEKGLVDKMLIIAPLRVCYGVWPAEIEKWADFGDLRYVIVHGPRKEEALNVEADIYLINPEGVEWLFSRPSLPEWSVLCLDESTKFKDTGTKRFKALRPRIPTFKRRWILTGTPVPNGIADLFGQIYVLDCGHSLGRYITHFRNRYFYRPGYSPYEWALLPGSFQAITEAVAPYVYQLKAEDYLKMPERIVVDIPIKLPPKARQMYKELEDTFMLMLEEDPLVAANAAVAGGKLRQIANGAIYNAEGEYHEIHDEKLDALEDLIEELSGKPILLLYEFNHDRERIQKRFPSVRTLPSGSNLQQLEKTISQFNAGEIPILLGHPASMGHGLNLQGACSHIIWFGITWNLEHYDQAIRRVYRQGQKASHIFIYRLVAENTRDENVAAALKEKDCDQNKIQQALKTARRATI